jgi:VWFA-related protein
MTRRHAATIVSTALAGAATLGLRAQTPSQPQPIFRGGTDLVTIDVSVRSNGSPIGALAARDFVLLDNGVRQTVNVVELEAIPVDITVLLDVTEDDSGYGKGLVEQARKILTLARPADRVRVMSVSTTVSDVIPRQPSETAPRVPDLEERGLPSAQDGLAAALMRQIEPDRRHLIIALTDGIDAMSTLDADAVRNIARRSTATLYIAQVTVALEPHLVTDAEPPIYVGHRQRETKDRCMASGVCDPSRLFWRPYDDEQFDTLKEAAEITGGELYLPGIFTNRTASAIFEKAFADYRKGYLLRFTPQGVTREGWHDVTVTIPGQPGVEIKARRGYAVDARERPPAATPVPTPRPAPARGLPTGRGGGTPLPASAPAIGDLTAEYDAGHYDAFVASLATRPRLDELIREFEANGNPWPANPAREAAFVVELAHAAIATANPNARDAAFQLLYTESKLVRAPLGPDAFERFWLWAGIIALEGANQPAAGLVFTDDALARFPDEPRFVLARAFFTDQRHALDDVSSQAAAAVAFVKDTAALYDHAIASDATANEARLRKGLLLSRAGKAADALAVLDATKDDGQDAGLTYLRHLFRAQTLDALNRQRESTDEYRAAMTALPSGQSARVGLMVGLLRQGDRPSAEALAEGIQTAPTTDVDPWWGYWLGDYRFYPIVIQRLREQR